MDDLDIFSAALELETLEQREKYLLEACGENAALRERIEALLRSSDKVSRFMEAPALGIEDGPDSPTLDQPLSEEPATQIGPYKLLQQIGEGGMGVVYMAEQKEPVKRRVALKIIKPGMDTRQVIARFEAERQALAMMDHANIARVLDARSTDSGRPYFIMELVNGIPVTQYCDEQHLTPRERLELFIPICQAVQHAHQKGVIHRDIKPSNVLVALYDGRPVPKVIDFGVAKATAQTLTEPTVFTQLGQIVGTLEYMSPEQAQRNQLDIDTRSDIYSLGVLLYELLTGETPFDKQRLRSAAWDEMLRIIREEEPLRPSHRLSSSDSLPSIAANRHIEPKKLSTLIQGELDWIVMKALEKDRGRRYETANGLAYDIRRYLNDEPVLARPASAAYRFRKFARRNKAAMATAGIIVATLLLGTGGATWQAIRATHAERSANQHLVAEQEAHHQTEMAEREAKQQLFKAHHAQAKATRASGRPGQRLEALDAVAKAVGLLEPLGLGEEARDALRDDAIGSLELVDVRPVRTWKSRQNLTQGATSLSGDFQLLAFSLDDSIHVRRPEQPTIDVVRIPTTRQMYEQFLLFDPTTRFLFRMRPADPTVYITEIATGKDVLVASGVPQAAAVDFHPRRPHLAVGDRNGVVRCLDLVSGQEIRKLSIGRPLWSVKYDPQGRRLAVGSGHVDVRDAETGEVVFKGAPLDGLGVLAWRPDGKWLAVGTTPDVHLFEVAPAEGRHLVLHGHRSAIIGLQFHPQGQLLASTSWDGTTRLWDSASGQQLLCVEGHLIGVSEDGQLLACRQGLDVVLFSVVTPCAHRWLPRGMTYAVAVAPGDRLMAACHDDGVRLWDLDQLEQVAYLPIGVTRGVAFPAPTGQLVTSGRAGLYQWPIRTESQGGVERVRLGPPEAINPDLKNMHSVHFSRDGSTLLSEAFFRDEAFLLHAADPGLPPIRLTRPGLSLSALSPDTKWAAASSSIAPDVRIWNAGTSGHVCDLPTPGGAQICFSPDGRSVITNAGPEMRIWDVGTWKPRHETSFKSDSASAIAFTSDSRIAAIGAWGVGVMLIEVETGRRVAMLDLPEKPPVYVGLEFTSDGSRLIAAVDHAGCCVWDIRALREQLATLGLDWNQPPLPKPDAATARPPIQVDIDLGDLAAKKPP